MAAILPSRYSPSLSRSRMPLPFAKGAITLAVSNGRNLPEAFTAVVYFRDAEGRMMFPPYAGFESVGSGLSGFLIGGGEPEHPATTTYAYSAPEGAAEMEIEIRGRDYVGRPSIAQGPNLVAGSAAFENAGSSAANPKLYLPISTATRALSVALTNGRTGSTKAFIARPTFYDCEGQRLAQPYEGFSYTTELGGFVYLNGGSASLPARTTLPFLPPEGAVRLELEILPWNYHGKAALASIPAASGVSVASALLAASGRDQRVDQLTQAVALAATGTRIAERLATVPQRVVGIFSAELAAQLGDKSALRSLPFDGYDQLWQSLRPSHLVIEAEALGETFGWEHALTLRDPAATAELAVLLERARHLGIRTLLVSPRDISRFPLLSRVQELFDRVLPPNPTQILD